MTDKEEHHSRPYRIKPTDDGSTVEDDYFDKETAYQAWQESSMAGTSSVLRKYWVLLVLLVFILIGFVFVYNAMRPKTNTVRLSQATVLRSRIDELESRLTRFEEQTVQRNAANEQGVQPEVIDRLSDRVDRLESSFKTWMEEISAKMETTPPKPVAKKTSQSTPKKSVISKKKEKKAPAKEKKVSTGDPTARYHTVQPQETLYRISLRYGLSVERLKEINQISGNMIKPGQKLQVSP